MSDTPENSTNSLLLVNPACPLTAEDVAQHEANLGFRLPESLRRFYLATNGGTPDRYVYEDANLDTSVSKFLPLHSDAPVGHAVATYRYLTEEKCLVAPQFFPFAVDGGGDYFLVDTARTDAPVYFYNSDTADESRRLLPLRIGFDAFCNALKREE